MRQLTVQEALRIALQHHRAGQLPHAEALYRQVLAEEPDNAVALHLLGVIVHQAGRSDAAVELIGRAIALRPDYVEAQNNLGNVLMSQGRLDEAVAAYRRAVALKPDQAAAHNNLGKALRNRGQLDEAIAACRQAIALDPGSADAHATLGNLLTDKGQLDEAIAACRRAVALRPDFPEAHGNLAMALKEKGQLDEALAACRQATALDSGLPEAYLGLGNILKDMGQLDQAIAAYRQAIALRPDYGEAHSNLVYTIHFHPGYDARSIAEEHACWRRQHAEPLKKHIQPWSNDRSPERRLRIGYVSPDLRWHSVGRFLLPLLAHHDKERVEVFAYADVPSPDAMTQRLRSYTDGWRDNCGLSDARVAELIRQDRIDILVDLASHTAHNRLLVFARKPAPVQVTYLAYCSTTGLETMDYRLSDPYLDGPGEDESCYTERTIRLPESYWCYQEDLATVQPSLPPAVKQGHVTFGCLNNFCKVSEPALAAWATILRATPNSQLLLHAHEGSHRQRVWQRLEREGIAPQRVQFVGLAPMKEYLEHYRRIDVALDTFPYGGGTTTCDALWMGSPVVSLVGKTAVGRSGLSILSNVGLPELAARSPEAYVRLASELGGDLARLAEWRSTLRRRMEQSPLMDAPRFARNVEAAYRQMWRGG